MVEKGRPERCKVTGHIDAPAALSPYRESRCPSNRMLDGPFRSSERFGREKNLNQIKLQDERNIFSWKKIKIKRYFILKKYVAVTLQPLSANADVSRIRYFPFVSMFFQPQYSI